MDKTIEKDSYGKILTPVYTTISRVRNGVTYTFGIDALKDQHGEVYYHAKDLKKIEGWIDQMEKDFKEWNPH